MVDVTDVRYLADTPIANMLAPDKAGPRMLPVTMALAAGVPNEINLMQAQLTGKENLVQAIEIDNTRGAADVLVSSGVQSWIISAGEVRLYPFYFAGTKLTFYCDVANNVPVKFFNVPLPPFSAQVKGTRRYGANSTGSGVILPAVPGKSYVITDVEMYLSGEAAAAAAGGKQFILTDGVANFARGFAYVPNASPATPGFGQVLYSASDIYFAGAVSAAISTSFSSSLTAGNLMINLGYTLI